MKSKLLLITLVSTVCLFAGIGSGNSTEGQLPVELTSFTAVVLNGAVKLTWETATEVNNYGFEIERASSSTMPRHAWETIGFVQGHGNSNSPKSYSFTDNIPLSGKVFYRLKQIDTDGKFQYSPVVEIQFDQTALKYRLEQNYPNPFSKSKSINSTTVISYVLPEKTFVSLKVYDILGKVIKTLVEEEQSQGSYKIIFNANSLPNGVYFYRLMSENFTTTKKMLILR